MKKFFAAILAAVMIISLSACTSQKELDEFEALRKSVESAGYEVSDVTLDKDIRDVSASFAVKVPFYSNVYAVIPIVLCDSESAAEKNCELFGEDSIKMPVRNGKIFSYPGRDYPNTVIDLVTKIVNGEAIPKNNG